MLGPSPTDVQPFETLDREWTLFCRQHRRPNPLVRWRAAEPALAPLQRLSDVIPPTHTDRTPLTNAVARLHIAGDDLAGRVLLQLLVPGMVRLTARWRMLMPGGVSEAGWEILTRAASYIALLRVREIRCVPAGYILRSVHRDLCLQVHEEQRRQATEAWAAAAGGQSDIPSAEDIVCSTTGVRDALRDAVNAGVLPADAAGMLWLVLSGCSVNEAAVLTGIPPGSSYRLAARTFAYLHGQLYSTDLGEVAR